MNLRNKRQLYIHKYSVQGYLMKENSMRKKMCLLLKETKKAVDAFHEF